MITKLFLDSYLLCYAIYLHYYESILLSRIHVIKNNYNKCTNSNYAKLASDTFKTKTKKNLQFESIFSLTKIFFVQEKEKNLFFFFDLRALR